MGIKLKYLSLLLLVLFISCKVQKQGNDSREQENYILAYKKAVIYGCIDAKTNKEFSKVLRKHKDMGLAREVAILFHAETFEAQNIGEKYSATIEAQGYYEDLKDLTPIFSDCVSYAFSQEIDSIARATYKKSR